MSSMRASSSDSSPQSQDGEKRCLNSELWHACAGPLVCLPTLGSRVVYFPQGHSEQVAASTNKEIDGQIPNYPTLPPQLICLLHNVTMHADVETDEVYAQMTLQPLSSQEQKEQYIPHDLGIPSKQPTNYFCKTLTASDTSTHGGFSVPRRAAEKVFPPLDFNQQPPAQELIARDLHDIEWKFRHIFRGQPKRHLLTTGWSVFVSAKRLVAGDSVIFIWNEQNQLLLGIRRANRPQTVMPSSVLSSDSMHIGLLAAAAHAAATNSRFTVFYNPRASPAEFVIPLTKYVKAMYHTRVSVGMRFRMLFETEESSVRRYMGTITSISDLDPVRWPNSHWRSVKVGWDESTAGERQPRVSLWEVEPLTTFPMYPSLFPLRLKRPWHPGLPSFQDYRDGDNNGFMCLRGDPGDRRLHAINFQSLGMGPWLQQRFDPLTIPHEQDQYQAMTAATLQDIRASDSFKQPFLQFQQPYQLMQQLTGQSNTFFSPQVISQPQQQQILDGNLAGIHLFQQQHQQQFMSSFDDKQKQQGHRQQNYPENAYQLSTAQIQQHQPSTISSSMSHKTAFHDSSMTAAMVLTPTSVQGISGSLDSEGTNSLINFTRIGQPVVSEQQQQNWLHPKFGVTPASALGNGVSLPPFPGKETAMGTQNCAADIHGHTLFGVNIDSASSLIPNQEHSLVSAAIETEGSVLPFSAAAYQDSLFNDVNDQTTLLQNSDQGDTAAGNFVKVYKPGSVGRWLDISRFSSYHQLRSELGQMFGIEGQLDDPLRSGWQLVFVDRENDVLLLGDDPWESFVNSVWYIKILSPEDVQKLGQQEFESPNQNGGARLSTEARNHASGIQSVSSLDY